MLAGREKRARGVITVKEKELKKEMEKEPRITGGQKELDQGDRLHD